MGYNLIFLSNCKHLYMKEHIEKFHLDDYFCAFYCAEDYDFMPKPEIFNLIKEAYSGEHIIIGDRFFDMEVAKIHELPSIGCAYGYCDEGELDCATIVVSHPDEIIDALSKL